MRIGHFSKNGVSDPVCGMRIDAQKTDLRVCHGGRTFYFCAEGCKHAFESDPGRYLQNSAARRGFWQRYLDRIIKATGGRPPACH